MADGKPKLLGISTRGNQTPLEIRRSTLQLQGRKLHRFRKWTHSSNIACVQLLGSRELAARLFSKLPQKPRACVGRRPRTLRSRLLYQYVTAYLSTQV